MQFSIVLPIEVRAGSRRKVAAVTAQAPDGYRRRASARHRAPRCCGPTAAPGRRPRVDRVDVDVVPRFSSFGPLATKLDGGELCDSVSGMWPSACHSHITRPVLTSISWITESETEPSDSPPAAREILAHGSNASIHAVPWFVRTIEVQVGVVAVAGPHVGGDAGNGRRRSRLRRRRSRVRVSVPATRRGPVFRRTDGAQVRRDSPRGRRWNQMSRPDWVEIIGPAVPIP